MVLFDSASTFWRNTLLKSNARSDIAQRLQNQLIEDYENIHNQNKVIMCSGLRDILSEVIPEMKENGRWVIYNTASAYDAMTEIFPNLKIRVPYEIRHKKRKTSPVLKYAEESMLTMWDYMDPLTDTDESYKVIRWDKIDNPILVFTNGGIPRIKIFNKKGEEQTGTYIGKKFHKANITKARAFDYTIIDGRYTLVGVVTLHGVDPKHEGGAHYTSYFLGPRRTSATKMSPKISANLVWYHYNDLGPSFEEIDFLPQTGVWEESHENMPAMYFYARTDLLSLGEPVKAKSPKKSPKEENLANEGFHYRRIDRPDGYTIFGLKDMTFLKKNIASFRDLYISDPEIIRTIYDPVTITWRVPSKRALEVEKKLKKISGL